MRKVQALDFPCVAGRFIDVDYRSADTNVAVAVLGSAFALAVPSDAAPAYKAKSFHLADAKGDGPQAPKDTHPPNLTDEKWDHGSTDAEIFATIKDGIGPKFDMKGFNSKLTPQEMWSIVNYIRSLGSKAATP